LLQRQAQRPHIGLRRGDLRPHLRLKEIRYRDRGENSNDSHDYQQFDQSKTRLPLHPSVHRIAPIAWN